LPGVKKSGQPKGYSSRELTRTPYYVDGITLYRSRMAAEEKSIFFYYCVYLSSED